MKVINLFASAGSGKSTTASYVFSELKQREKYNVELITEVAKDLVYEGNHIALLTQEYVFGEQSYRLSRLKDKVDIAITDSPILLSGYYNTCLPQDAFNQVIMSVYNSYDNVNVWINRVKKFNPNGRTQKTAEEADKLAIELKEYLTKELGIIFDIEINGDLEGMKQVVNYVCNE